MKLPQFQGASVNRGLDTVAPGRYTSQGNVFNQLAGNLNAKVQQQKREEKAQLAQEKRDRKDILNRSILKANQKITAERATLMDATDEEGNIPRSMVPTELNYKGKVNYSSKFENINGHLREVTTDTVPLYAVQSEYMKLQSRLHKEGISKEVQGIDEQEEFNLRVDTKIEGDYIKDTAGYINASKTYNRNQAEKQVKAFVVDREYNLARKAVDMFTGFSSEERKLQHQIIDELEEENHWISVETLKYEMNPDGTINAESKAEVDAQLVQAENLLTSENYSTTEDGRLSLVKQRMWAGRIQARRAQLNKSTLHVDKVHQAEVMKMASLAISQPWSLTPDRIESLSTQLMGFKNKDGSPNVAAVSKAKDILLVGQHTPILSELFVSNTVGVQLYMDKLKIASTDAPTEEERNAALQSFSVIEKAMNDYDIDRAANSAKADQDRGVLLKRRMSVNETNFVGPQMVEFLKLTKSDAQFVDSMGKTPNALLTPMMQNQMAAQWKKSDEQSKIAFAIQASTVFEEDSDQFFNELVKAGMPSGEVELAKSLSDLPLSTATALMEGVQNYRAHIKTDTEWKEVRLELEEKYSSEAKSLSISHDEYAAKFEIVMGAAYRLSSGDASKAEESIFKAMEMTYGGLGEHQGYTFRLPKGVTSDAFHDVIMSQHPRGLVLQGYKPISGQDSAKVITEGIQEGIYKPFRIAPGTYIFTDVNGNPIKTKTEDGEENFQWQYSKSYSTLDHEDYLLLGKSDPNFDPDQSLEPDPSLIRVDDKTKKMVKNTIKGAKFILNDAMKDVKSVINKIDSFVEPKPGDDAGHEMVSP